MLLRLMVCSVGGLLVAWGLAHSVRFLIDRATQRAERERINALIAAAGAKPRAGMEEPDWSTIDRVGARKWQETLRAQRRQQAAGERFSNVREFQRSA